MTLVRIGGRDLDRLWLAEGEALPTDTLEGLCRTQVTVRIGSDAVSELLDHPLGNHLVLVPGHHRARLLDWWRWIVAEPAVH